MQGKDQGYDGQTSQLSGLNEKLSVTKERGTLPQEARGNHQGAQRERPPTKRPQIGKGRTSQVQVTSLSW